MSDYLVSLIRTWTPIAVGALITWLAARGLNLDTDAQAGLVTAATAILTGVYYTLVRGLETRWPALGKLLGASRAPAYERPVPEAVRALRNGY